jgi:hypothetical protein
MILQLVVKNGLKLELELENVQHDEFEVKNGLNLELEVKYELQMEHEVLEVM